MSNFRVKKAIEDSELRISVKVNDDDSITLEWDETSEIAKELGVNNWSESDWVEFLKDYDRYR